MSWALKTEYKVYLSHAAINHCFPGFLPRAYRDADVSLRSLLISEV